MQRYFSNIYWHFTGGPSSHEKDWWSDIKSPRGIPLDKLKQDETAVSILIEILKSRKLLANCTERIVSNLRTDVFCCVCDIPFKDLVYHSKYYGKTAIGFSATRIHQDFNPVLYLEDDFPIPLSLEVDDSIMLDDETTFDDKDSDNKFFRMMFGLDSSPQYRKFLTDYLGNLKKFVKITRFSDKDEETFYREREWRSRNGDVSFKLDEVEMVIVPKRFIPRVNSCLSKLDANHVSVIAYELLEKV